MVQGGHLGSERIEAPVALKGGESLRLAGAVYVPHDHARPFGAPLRGAARVAAEPSCAATRAGEEVVTVQASNHNDNWTMGRKRSRSRSRSQNGETNGTTDRDERENDRERRGNKGAPENAAAWAFAVGSSARNRCAAVFRSASPANGEAFDSAASVFS